MLKIVISVNGGDDNNVEVKLNSPKKSEIEKATEIEKEVAKWVYDNVDLTLKNFTGSEK